MALALFLMVGLTPNLGRSAEHLAASSSFQAGQKAFEAGKYQEALTLFNQARAAGLDKPALYHNIGVCAYKLGRYEEARQAFLQAATFAQMAPLASYNLALVADKQGDPEAAMAWLKKSLATADKKDRKLVLLAQTALSRIESRQGKKGPWMGFVSLGLGYDDNVTMVENNDLQLASEEGDSFTDLFAFARTPFWGDSAGQGPYLQGSLSIRDYTDLHEYDTGALQLEGRYRHNSGDFQLEGGAAYNYVYWDHGGYSQSPLFILQARRFISDSSFFRLAYQYAYLDMLHSDYDYLQGSQQRATAEFSTPTGPSRLLLGYSLEENHRRDKEFSPRRHLFRVTLELPPLARVTALVAASYRHSTYDLAGSHERNDDRYETSLRLGYALTQKWEASALIRHTNNNSTHALYDYSRTVTSISLGYSF